LAALALEEEINQVTSIVTRTWLRLVYRVEPRSTWTSVSKVPNTWADTAANNVVIVREYRDTCQEVSGSAYCSGSGTLTVDAYKATFLSPAFSSMSPSLVADNLSSVNQSGAAITPFVLNTITQVDPTTGAITTSQTITMTFQGKRYISGVTTFTPSSNSMTLAVQARNVN
ncbi:hypothetical protein, partial [Deinococcus sp.]|uniref:hypothetical protein n=1 Tax=Deinococcus sp. TaxID=47478 RepID=UPI0028699FA4